MSQSSNADQIAFWNSDAGAKWVKAQDRLDAMLSPISAEIMKAAAPKSGERVLDIGCGCGDTALELARQGARVTGVDVSAPMLARAKERALQAHASADFVEADASNHRFSPEFDLAFSRFGVMFFADPDAAFANIRMGLKPGGRLAFVCWRDWRENEWVRVPVGAVRAHVPPQPQLGPEDPGPFAFADLARVRRILTAGGFDRITARPFDCDMTLGTTFDEAVQHIQNFGPVSRMLTDATAAQKEAAVVALQAALKPYAARKPVTLGGAVWIVTAAA